MTKRFSGEADGRQVECLKELASSLKQLLDESKHKIVDDCLDIYSNNEFVIMVCGEVSVGKSSLLNTLMGVPVLLTDQTETTAAITYIRSSASRHCPQGVEDKIRVTFRDRSRNPEWLDFTDKKRMLELTTSLHGNDKAISQVEKAEVFLSEKTMPIPPEITIIDTPGLNGSEAHGELTYSEMGKCHVALYLVNANKFGTRTNRDEFRKLYRYAPEVLFIVSKWDQARGGYLGEYPTMEGLSNIKRDEFMPKFGKWADSGAMDDDNIFVISTTEADKCLMAYYALDEEQREKTTLVSLLPSEDNEYFLLEARLKEIMDNSENRRIAGRCPLITMRNLAENRLQEIQSRLDEVDFTEQENRLEQEHIRLMEEQVRLEEVFEELKSFAKHAGKREKNVLLNIIDDGKSKIRRNFMDRLETYGWREMYLKESENELQMYLDSMAMEYINSPVAERYSAFIEFLKGLLESELSIDTAALKKIGDIDYQDDTSELDRKNAEFEKKLDSLENERKSIEHDLNAKKSEIERNKQDIATLKIRMQRYDEIRRDIENVKRQISSLGPRPAVQSWRERSTKTIEVKRSFGERIFGVFKGENPFRSTRKEEVTRFRNFSDDSAQREWDNNNSILDSELRRLKKEVAPFDRLNERKIKLEGRNRFLAVEIDNLRQRHVRLQEDTARELGLQGKFQREEVVHECRNKWNDRMDRMFTRFDYAVKDFQEDIDRILDDYWMRRDFAVKKYSDDISASFRRKQEESRNNCGGYQQLLNKKLKLENIICHLEDSLKNLNPSKRKL